MDHALASWVPTEVLVGALTIALGGLYRLWSKGQKAEEERAKKNDERLAAIERALIPLVTRDEVLAIRDRHGERIAATERELAITKDRLEYRK